MKKIIVFCLILLLAILLIFFLFFHNKEELIVKTENLELVNEGTVIKILNEKQEKIFVYQFDDFKQWAEDNWSDIFPKAPAFGEIREVSPSNFYQFDQGASLSPDFNYLAFSVNDYAVATNISFIVIVKLDDYSLAMIRGENKGAIEQLLWSPKSTHIAYLLDSARARADGLSVDNVKEMDKEFTLSAEDILNQLIDQADHPSRPYLEFMPNFADLKWSEDGRRLEFSTASPEILQLEERIYWSIDLSTHHLRREFK